jgi:hypothetical protein
MTVKVTSQQPICQIFGTVSCELVDMGQKRKHKVLVLLHVIPCQAMFACKSMFSCAIA